MPRSQNIVQILIQAKYQAAKQLKEAEKDLNSLQSTLKKTAAVMTGAGLALGGSLLYVAQQTAKYGDEAKKFERATGIQANTLATLRYAIQRWGGTVRDADTSLRRFTKAVADAASGLDSYVRQFERLGLTQDDLIGPDGSLRKIDDLLPIVADAFKNLKDDVTAAGAAQILFGRTGLRILPAFKQGAEGLELLSKRAERLGILFHRDLLEAAEDFMDKNLDIRESLKGVMYALGSQMLPAIIKYMAKIVELNIKIKDWVKTNKDLGHILLSVSGAILGVGGVLVAVTSLTKAVQFMAVTLHASTGLFGLLAGAVTALAAAFIYLRTSQRALPDTLEGVNKEIFLVDTALEDLRKKSAAWTPPKPGIWSEADQFSSQWQDSLRQINPYINKIKELEKYLKELEARHDELKEAARLEREAAELEAKYKAAITQGQIEDAKRLKAVLDDMQFDLRLSQGLETYPSAIERQKGIIEELSTGVEKQRMLTAKVVNNIDLYTQAETKLYEMERALIESKQKLIDLEKEFAEKTGESADGVKRLADEQAKYQEQIRDLREQLEQAKELQDAAKEAVNSVQNIFQGGFQSMFASLMQETNTFGQMWKRFWIGLASSALAALATIAAKAAALWFVQKMFTPTSILPIIGAPIKSIFGGGVAVAQAGGEVIAGTRGRDSVPMLLGRGENITDHRTTDRLKQFLNAAEAGIFGSNLNVNINAGILLGTDRDAYELGDITGRAISDYNDRFVSEGMD